MKTVIYQISYESTRMKGDIISLEDSFKTLEEAESYWNHLSLKDKNSMPNAFVERIENTCDEYDVFDSFVTTVKYL